MGKEDKKKAKLIERIAQLEEELKDALTKKISNVKEVNVGKKMNEINELRKVLNNGR